MLLSFLVGCAFTQDRVAASPPWSEALGRPLSWDPKGAYALDVESPLSEESRQIVKDMLDAELGRAESLARFRIVKEGNDLVPAWALAQIIRVRKRAVAEYDATVKLQIDQPASLATLLYRFHICRLAEKELPEREQGTNSATWREMDANLKRLRDV